MKTRRQIEEYMWKVYPKDTLRDQLCRAAMLKAYEFLDGTFDSQEAQRNKIATQIMERLNKDFKT